MPRGDRRGPFGAGPMTGRGAGYCAGNETPGYQNRPSPYGFWRCLAGFGRGWRRQFYATGKTGWQRAAGVASEPEAELTALQRQLDWLTEQIETIKKRLAELTKT